MAGLTAAGGLAGGHTEALCPSLCVLEEKISLTMHKGETLRPSPERPGLGRGVAGGLGALWRGWAPAEKVARRLTGAAGMAAAPRHRSDQRVR